MRCGVVDVSVRHEMSESVEARRLAVFAACVQLVHSTARVTDGVDGDWRL